MCSGAWRCIKWKHSSEEEECNIWVLSYFTPQGLMVYKHCAALDEMIFHAEIMLCMLQWVHLFRCVLVFFSDAAPDVWTWRLCQWWWRGDQLHQETWQVGVNEDVRPPACLWRGPRIFTSALLTTLLNVLWYKYNFEALVLKYFHLLQATANMSCSRTFFLVNSVYTNSVVSAGVHV